MNQATLPVDVPRVKNRNKIKIKTWNTIIKKKIWIVAERIIATMDTTITVIIRVMTIPLTMK